MLVRNEYIGVNFIDTYFRSGLYPRPSFPSGLGEEGAGTVEAVGPGGKGRGQGSGSAQEGSAGGVQESTHAAVSVLPLGDDTHGHSTSKEINNTCNCREEGPAAGTAFCQPLP